MIHIAVFVFTLVAGLVSAQSPPETVDISFETLRDKIRGGWAAQTIGVTFGGPTEFRYNGTMIQPYEPIPWYDGYLHIDSVLVETFRLPTRVNDRRFIPVWKYQLAPGAREVRLVITNPNEAAYLWLDYAIVHDAAPR